MDARRVMEAASAAIRSMDAYAAMERAIEGHGAQIPVCSSPISECVRECDKDVERAEGMLGAYTAGNPGKRGAEALRLHYIALMRWRDVAGEMGLSESGARTAARVALTWLDARGGGVQ